ncbi:MAG TPA: glycoside hydrolase family 16 protein, partial [Nocardioidaceae bacterium]|nr:glycoside hydrolase family 16 protein [Nocardioidaceae bacterium]
GTGPRPIAPTPTLDEPPCGGTLPKDGGGTWVCTFADEFDGKALDRTKWAVLTTPNSGFTNGGECYVDSPQNISVSGGELQLSLRELKKPRRCPGLITGPTSRFTAAMVTSTGRFAQAYGRFEIRARFPAYEEPGLHSALWLWPQNDLKYGARPASGEIDIAEFYTTYPDRVIPYVHFLEAFPGQSVTNTECFVERPDEFHTYLLEWTPETMTISYDGAPCVTTIWQAQGLGPPAPFDMPFFVNLTQGLGQAPNDPKGDLPLPATMEVDYVRVWS